MRPDKLPIPEFFRLYEGKREQLGWIDVRSEGEFAKASLPGFSNLPILTDSERHEVGLTYKRKGQDEAVRVGHRLVDPERPARVRAWVDALERAPGREGVMICWRGGMRSEIAAQWSSEAGGRVRTVAGGIKAIRGELLRSFEPAFLPPLLILAGLTGSGKTELLQSVARTKIDLEGIANHRGSSFGRRLASPQPPQARFENELALELRRSRRELESAPVLLEDESGMIGSCFIPGELKLAMSASSCVWVESTPAERASRIHREYLLEPLGLGFSPDAIRDSLIAALERIRKKLGGLEATQIRALLEAAFARGIENGDEHSEWITRLLTLYYDPMYRYGFEQNVRAGRKILFRGTTQECLQWLRSN